MTDKSLIVYTPEVRAMIGVGKTWFYTYLLKTEDFPKPFKVGLRANAWKRADIEVWIEQRAAQAA